jgi:serine-type D-Ala-D-Ala carboxypeptidase (penicillin-binding protein 5/6)
LKRSLHLALALAGLVLPAEAVPQAAIPTPPADVANIPVYLAVDLSSGQVLAGRDADRPFLPASVTKVMTAWVAFQLIAAGKLSPEQTLTVRPETWRAWSGQGTGMHLKSGELVSVDALLHGITTVSANNASVVLAEGALGSVAAWTAMMNDEARKLGMTQSHFATPNGWPDGGATHVSAADLVRLGQAMIERHPDLYERYFGQKTFTWNGVTGQNHDPMLGVVPGADGIKTGHTNESGYSFLGTAQRDGRRIMIVIGGAPSGDQRAAGARALVEWGFSSWQSRPLFRKAELVGEALVQSGDTREVGLLAGQNVSVTVPHGAQTQPTLRIRYRGPLVAPFEKGAELAELEVAVPGQPVARLPLVAARAVGAAGPLDRLLNGLAGLWR